MNTFNLQEIDEQTNVSNLQTAEDCENDLNLNYKTPGHPMATPKSTPC